MTSQITQYFHSSVRILWGMVELDGPEDGTDDSFGKTAPRGLRTTPPI